MKWKVSKLSSAMQSMKDMLHDHYQRHSDPVAQQTVKNIQKVVLYIWGSNCILDLTLYWGNYSFYLRLVREISVLGVHNIKD